MASITRIDETLILKAVLFQNKYGEILEVRTMSDPDRMPRVDFTKDTKLKAAFEYAKVVEKQNVDRALKLRKVRKSNLWVGGVLGALVLGVYSYSIFAVKQEVFLDDFNEPEREKI